MAIACASSPLLCNGWMPSRKGGQKQWPELKENARTHAIASIFVFDAPLSW